MSSIRIARRFCGPPDSGNGGYSSGRLAAFVPGGCECTIRKPIPIERELEVQAGDSAARLFDGGELVIEAAPVKVTVDRVAGLSEEAADEAAAKSPAFQNHPFPTCFTCGPDRAAGDGLRIFPGHTGTDGEFAAPWLPDESLADAGVVRPEFVWAAMDCPTGFAAGFPWAGTLVTGRLAVEITAPVRPAEPHVIVSWPAGIDGRKHHAFAALYGPGGEMRARARATWIKLR